MSIMIQFKLYSSRTFLKALMFWLFYDMYYFMCSYNNLYMGQFLYLCQLSFKFPSKFVHILYILGGWPLFYHFQLGAGMRKGREWGWGIKCLCSFLVEVLWHGCIQRTHFFFPSSGNPFACVFRSENIDDEGILALAYRTITGNSLHLDFIIVNGSFLKIFLNSRVPGETC